MAEDSTLELDIEALDDGLPNPPAKLTYRFANTRHSTAVLTGTKLFFTPEHIRIRHLQSRWRTSQSTMVKKRTWKCYCGYAQRFSRSDLDVIPENANILSAEFWQDSCGTSWTGDSPDFSPVFIAHGPGGRTTSVWDFTAAVKYWTNEKHPNHGFCMYAGINLNSFMFVNSREVKEVKNRPALFVMYEPAK
jgi:hypothetical protein